MAQRQAPVTDDWETVTDWGDDDDWETVGQTPAPTPTAPAQPKPSMGFMDAAKNVFSANPILQLGVGAFKGLAGTAKNLGAQTAADNALLGAKPLVQNVDTAPSNTMQSIGKGVEQVAEFAIPGKAMSMATKGAPLLGRMAGEAAVGAGVGTIQGQGPLEAGVSGAISAAVPVAGKVWPAAKDFVARKVSPRLMNSLMEVKPTALDFGHDPGGRVVKEGIIAANEDSLLAQIRDRLKDAGVALDAKLASAPANQTIDASDIVINALDNAVQNSGLAKEAAFRDRVETVMDVILKKSAGKLSNLTPKEAQTLKSEIGTFVAWNEGSLDKPINKAIAEIYRGLNKATEAIVSDIKPLLSRYGDLKVAEDALDYAIQSRSTRAFASPQGPWASAMRMMGTTPNKTFGTQVLNRLMNPSRSMFAETGGRSVTGGLAAGMSPQDEYQ